MLSKNVIREDVVQISFNVNDNPLNDLIKSLQNLQASVTKVVDDITSRFSKVRNSANNIADEIKNTGKEVVTTGDRFHKMVDEISKIPTAKLREMPKILDSSANAAKDFISSLKSDIFSKLTNGVQKLKTSIKNISFSSLKSDITSFGVKLKDVISTSWSKFTSNLSNVGVALKNVGTTVVNVAGKVQNLVSKPYRVVLKASDEVSGVLNGIMSKIINIKNALFGLITTGLAAKSVGFVADQQDLEAQYKILLGSKEAAEATVQNLINFASKTPYAREDIFQANRQLLIFGGTALATEKTLRLVGDTAAGTGQSFSDTAYRIGQVYTALKSGNSPGIYIKSLQQTGALSAELADKLNKLAESGASFETKWAEVEKALSRYNGTMEEMSRNMNNLILGVKTFVKQKFLVPFGQGIVDTIQPVLVEFKKWRNENADTITQWGEKIKSISALITRKLITGIKKLIGFVNRLKEAFVAFYHSDQGQTITKTLKKIIDTVIQNKKKILSIISSIAGAISTLLIINKVKTAFSAFTKVFGGISSTAMIVIGIFALLFYAFQHDIGGIRELFRKLADLFIRLGQKIIPVLCSAFEFLIKAVLPILETILEGIIGFLNDNLDWIAPMILGIVAAFLAFKVAVVVANTVMVIQKGIIIAIKTVMIAWKIVILAVQAAQWLLNIAMSANPAILVITLILALIAVFVYFWITSEDFRNFWIGLWETICEWCKIGYDWIVNLFTKWIPEAFGKVINFFVDLWKYVKNLFFSTISAICNWFAELPYNIGFFIGQIIGHILQLGISLWNFATVTVPQFVGKVVIYIAELPAKIWKWLCETAYKVGQFFADLIKTGILKTQEFVNSVYNFMKELPGKVWNAIVGAVQKIIEWGRNLLKVGIEAARNVVNGIWKTLCELPGKMLEIGKNIVSGLWNGICSAIGWLRDSIKGFAKGILDGIKSVLGIHSPSILFRDEVGRNLALGLSEGFISSMDEVKTEMQKAVPTSFGSDINMNLNAGNQHSFGINKSDLSEYTPENSYTTSSKTNYESNAYSPQFNLTINGSVTDRDTQRKIKQFMKEAMQEAFQSMERKRPALVEV